MGTPQDKFVQILNIRQCHWVTVSDCFCNDNEVAVYDCKRAYLDTSTLQALSCLLRPKSNHIDVLQPAVQQQTNHSNCGLFAIAFGFAICKGLQPERCTFHESRVRAQLYVSLTKSAITYTIKSRESEITANMTTTSVPGYCIFRTAYYREVMVQCCNCLEWYHPTCVDIPRSVIGRSGNALNATADLMEST